MVLDFLKFRRRDDTAHELYSAIVAQARQPDLYRGYHVPDTVDGRFDMILLHCILVFCRFRGDSEDARRRGQEVFDVFLDDMDRNLREMGVGDISVPKKMKKMVNAFYGRLQVYVEALDSGDEARLARDIARNVFPDVPADDNAAGLARYAMTVHCHLAAQDIDRLVMGSVVWPEVGAGSGR